MQEERASNEFGWLAVGGFKGKRKHFMLGPWLNMAVKFRLVFLWRLKGRVIDFSCFFITIMLIFIDKIKKSIKVLMFVFTLSPNEARLLLTSPQQGNCLSLESLF